MSLIDILNENVHKSPDEIAALINSHGWIKCSDIPTELWERWNRSNTDLAICVPHSTGGGFSLIGTTYNSSLWTLDVVRRDLGMYYMVPNDEYDGHNPKGGLFSC